MHITGAIVFVSVKSFPEVRKRGLETLNNFGRHLAVVPLAEIVVDAFPSFDE
jgi:hypothetical protein